MVGPRLKSLAHQNKRHTPSAFFFSELTTSIGARTVRTEGVHVQAFASGKQPRLHVRAGKFGHDSHTYSSYTYARLIDRAERRVSGAGFCLSLCADGANQATPVCTLLSDCRFLDGIIIGSSIDHHPTINLRASLHTITARKHEPSIPSAAACGDVKASSSWPMPLLCKPSAPPPRRSEREDGACSCMR